MSENIIPRTASNRVSRTGWTLRLARKAVHTVLSKLSEGRLILADDAGVYTFGQTQGETDLRVRILVRDPRFYKEVAMSGSLGAAEAYIQGWWTTDNLTQAIRLFARNMTIASDMDRGLARLTRLAARAWHAMRPNTRRGSRDNIHAHYDMGNDFFSLWLDDTMTYSAAIFERDDMTLAEASTAKLDRICRKLDLQPTDHLLEIGTGWGSMAMHAAKHFGCRVTTTTISREQHRLAIQRIEAAGLGDRVDVLLEDYRDLTGQYDKLVSIEMVEAVGHKYLDTYFAQCSRLLKPDGMMLLQAITMNDQGYADYLRSVDFIQRYVFPGSNVPSTTALQSSITRATDMRIAHLEDFGPHYARTLAAWRKQFFEQIDAVRALGYDDRFIRLWDYYLSYCEAGFAERYIGVAQMQLIKPRCQRDSILGDIERQTESQP